LATTRREHDSTLEQSVPGEEGEMSGLEQELGLSLGVLIDVVDEQWMRDTLPAEGASPSLPRWPNRVTPQRIRPLTLYGFADIPVPPAMAVKTEDAEDPAPASTLTFSLPFTLCCSVLTVAIRSDSDLVKAIAKRQLA
jgi:anaphase-promoting complex subunit 13